MYKSSCISFLTILSCIIAAVLSAETTAEVIKPPVVRPYYNYSESDAHTLHKALEGLGTDDSAVVDVITRRTNSERQILRDTYADKFHKDLLKDLKGDLSGKFQDVIIALMRGPTEYLAAELHRTVNSGDSDAVTQILATKSRNELEPITETYLRNYNESLNTAIRSAFSEDYGLFLMNVISTPSKMRRDSGIVKTLLDDEVAFFPNRADSCGVINNQQFDETMAKESFEQIRTLLGLYEKKYGKPAVNCINEWCTGELQHAYRTIVEYAENPVTYYANQLREAMIGLGTSDSTLIRIVVSRSEIDLYKIAKTYEELYNTTLASSITAETSGYYKATLLKIIDLQH